MREYGIISTKIWRRGSGKRLRGNAVAISLACYLCSSPNSTLTGVYYVPLSTICEELGFTLEQVREGLVAVEAAGFAFYDEAESLAWVPNHAEIEIGATMRPKDKRRGKVQAELRAIGNHRFVTEFLNRYAEPFGLVGMGHPDDEKGHPREIEDDTRSGSVTDQDHNQSKPKLVGGSGVVVANDSDPPKSERRPSRPPPPDPFGATFLVEAWREGVSLATGVPCTPLKPYERSDLDGFVSVHSGGLSGPALREWVRDTAKAFAEASDAKFGFTPKRCAGWLDSGRPGRRDAKQDSSLQKTAGDEPWRANIKVTDL